MKCIVAVLLLFSVAGMGWFVDLPIVNAAEEPAETVEFQDDPAAHALYDKMVEAMRSAESLYIESGYQNEAKGEVYSSGMYKIWLKKPNYFRMEVFPSGDTSPKGILVGDGENLWIYWPNGKPRYGWEFEGERAELYEKHKNTFYMTKYCANGMHSISHEACWLGMGMTVLDPSTFHGYTDSLQQYVDGVQSMGTETVGGEECEIIEVSIMKHQRSWILWIAKKDTLPRKLKQIVRVSYDIIMHEQWTTLKINSEMDNQLFVWKPGEDWLEWKKPPIEEGLLKKGTMFPDFDLASIDGGRIRLSDYKGKIIWFYIFRAG